MINNFLSLFAIAAKKTPVPNWEARLTPYGAINIYNKKVKEHYALKDLLEGY